MRRIGDDVTALVPALAFLLAAVPLAWLLDRLGFFDSLISILSGRGGRAVPTWTIWALAAATTVVLNLDTTVVLLTPLALRLARRAEVDPLPMAAIPLLLASLASSVLPVSNLTTLIVTARLHLTVSTVVAHLGPPSVAAVVVGWVVHRRCLPRRIEVAGGATPDGRALLVGGPVVLLALVGFVVGPSFGIEPWATALAADVALMVAVRSMPWRHLPLATAAVVAAVAALVSWAVPSGIPLGGATASRPIAVGGAVVAGSVLAGLVNNLPALLAGMVGAHHMTWGRWAWLLGVNVGAVLLPLGALANLLWWRIVRRDGLDLRVRSYLTLVALPGGAALVAATAVLVLERLAWR